MSNLNENNETMQKKVLTLIKATAKKWSLSVTYHLFPKIFKDETHAVARIFYAFLFLVLTTLTCLILAGNIISYYKYDIVSTVQIINEAPTLFPTITICD
jgi:hypothetical protein